MKTSMTRDELERRIAERLSTAYNGNDPNDPWPGFAGWHPESQEAWIRVAREVIVMLERARRELLNEEKP